METYAETLNKARDMAYVNNRPVYIYHNKGWNTTFVKAFANQKGNGKYTVAYTNGKWEKINDTQ